MDAQSRAFREASTEDLVSDQQLMALIENGELLAPNPDDPIKSPDEWHATGWDEGRQDPKSLEEARDALRSRATQSHERPNLYDDLGE